MRIAFYTLYNEDGGCHQAYGGRAALWEICSATGAKNSWSSPTTSIPSASTTKIAATNRIYCLMQNPTYRVQCTYKGYYRASYVDYYLGADMPAIPIPPVSDAAFVWRGGAPAQGQRHRQLVHEQPLGFQLHRRAAPIHRLRPV